jgi:CheY-like chemotaxis protein
MAKVLLVENDGLWLDLIRGALPEYEVYKAQSYKEALELLGGGVTYDVAIVDLNLLPKGANDKLGGELLKYMRVHYPTIRRIVLTGEPPTSTRGVFDEYDPEDLLLKDHMDMSVVRRVVETALEHAAGDVPDKFKFEKLQLRNSLRSWKEPVLLRLTQRARTLQNDIDEAGRTGKKADNSAATLAELNASREKLEAECANLEAMIADIRRDDDRIRAGQEFEGLKAVYGA